MILYVDSSLEHARLDTLRAQGHQVIALVLDPSPDLILSPVAHCWVPAMWETAAYFEAALKGIRAKKKGKV